jgi:hypothetical protein
VTKGGMFGPSAFPRHKTRVSRWPVSVAAKTTLRLRWCGVVRQALPVAAGVTLPARHDTLHQECGSWPRAGVVLGCCLTIPARDISVRSDVRV